VLDCLDALGLSLESGGSCLLPSWTNGTWELVPRPKGKKIIGSKWVFKVKTNADGSVERYKGRLVAKGYNQRPGFDYLEIFAPTVRMPTIQVVLAMAAIEDL